VVVNGDVIISGPITGIGTLYVGGNLYIAGDMTYLNGPSFASPPNMMTQANRDAWVRTAIESNKDMFSFAVRESILGGAVNSTDWKTACYDAASYGLKNVGAEGNLGADGIAGTPDDGIAFRDTNGDGVPDSAWNDVDGDGVVDAAYNYSTQIQVTAARAALIDRYPTNTSGYLSYDSLSTNSMNRLDGIFYCNHAMAMRLSKANAVVNGSYICQNEAIVFSTSLKFTHDARAHSRYSADPFCFVDFALPVAQKVRIESVTEIAPQTEPQT
jgi:hypothetical protein